MSDSALPQPQAATSMQSLALVPLGIALNLALGTLVHTMKAPIYLDAVGTIAITLIAGLRAGVMVGVSSFLLGGILTNPVLPWFAGTQAVIALFVHWAGTRGGFKNIRTTLLSGIGLGIAAGLASAPIITYLFSGITGSGASLVAAFLLASGKSLLRSVVLSGLAAEPIDKTLQCLLALWLLRSMPQTLLSRFRGGTLRENGLVQ